MLVGCCLPSEASAAPLTIHSGTQLDQQLLGSEVRKDHWISWPWLYFLWFKVSFLVWCENVWGVLSVDQMLCKPLGSGAY